jgi:hypothetical protein
MPYPIEIAQMQQTIFNDMEVIRYMVHINNTFKLGIRPPFLCIRTDTPNAEKYEQALMIEHTVVHFTPAQMTDKKEISKAYKQLHVAHTKLQTIEQSFGFKLPRDILLDYQGKSAFAAINWYEFVDEVRKFNINLKLKKQSKLLQ